MGDDKILMPNPVQQSSIT